MITHAGVWRVCERCGFVFERKDAIAVSLENGIEVAELEEGGEWTCAVCRIDKAPKDPGVKPGRVNEGDPRHYRSIYIRRRQF